MTHFKANSPQNMLNTPYLVTDKLATKYPTQMLPIMEHFYTLQGEGTHQGKAAYFVRLGGCTVGCHWCDVKESWNADQHPLLSIDELVEHLQDYPSSIVVITGGEPLIYQLDYLCQHIQHAGKRTHLETSGSYPLSGNWDWICLSPKKFKAPLPDVLAVANELKVVIYNRSDFAWAEKHAAMVSPTCQLYLQPEWSHANEMLPLIIDYIKTNPQWTISLQIHKYMAIP